MYSTHDKSFYNQKFKMIDLEPDYDTKSPEYKESKWVCGRVGKSLSIILRGLNNRYNIHSKLNTLINGIFSGYILSEGDYEFLTSLSKEKLEKFTKTITECIHEYDANVLIYQQVRGNTNNSAVLDYVLKINAGINVLKEISKRRKDIEIEEIDIDKIISWLEKQNGGKNNQFRPSPNETMYI